MLNFSTPDFSVDPTDATCVDTDTCPLCNILANSHITAKYAIEGVININKNTAGILSKRCTNSCHDRSRDVDFVFGNGIVILFNVV